MSTTPGDFTLQMPGSLRSQLEVITGECDPDKLQRRGGIIHLTVDVPSAHATGETRPPRWRTVEFMIYYIVFIAVFSWMVYVPMELSSSAYFFILRRVIMVRLFGFRDTPELQLVSP